MPRFALVLLFCSFAFAQGCLGPLPLRDMIISEVRTETTRTISMGETIYTHYDCPCTRVYRAERDIEIVGYRTIPNSSLWEAKYQNVETGDFYLVRDQYHPLVALVLKNNGAIDPAYAVVQYRGAKRQRSWRLASRMDVQAMRFDHYRFSGHAWRLQYIGPDGSSSSVIRLSIAEYGRGDFSERVGQIEYRHDIANGNEFVVRGLRVRIDDVAADGLITFTILNIPD
jgi:hypothetical protein